MRIYDKAEMAAIRKELRHAAKIEKRLERAAMESGFTIWKKEMQKKIPQKIYNGLEGAFHKGFSLTFNHGRTIIEKTVNKDNLISESFAGEYAVRTMGVRRGLKLMGRNADGTKLRNMAITTAEGVALGILGVGMPDIILFISTLLRGIYETALNYGFDYESGQEQLLILKMMGASMSYGEQWVKKNSEVDEMLRSESVCSLEMAFDTELKETSSAFAMDMLFLKFIQGIPVVGVIGGAANPIYFGKVMKYVQLKYRKRYLLKQLGLARSSQPGNA